jgi:excisionase family DNA binding protein
LSNKCGSGEFAIDVKVTAARLTTMKPRQRDTVNEALVLSTRDVAKLMQCSDRHITNLRKQGRMPPCIKLGTLVRWPRTIIEGWIASGCPAVDESAQSDSVNNQQVA